MLTLTVSGTVSDYADTSSLRQKIATAAGVEDASLVTISVEAASVIITATIAVPATTTAAAVQSTVSSNLGTAADASAALGVTVEAVPTVTITVTSSAPPPPSNDDVGLPMGAIIGIAAGGGIVPLLVVVVGICCMMKRKKKAISPVQEQRTPAIVAVDAADAAPTFPAPVPVPMGEPVMGTAVPADIRPPICYPPGCGRVGPLT